MSSEIERLSIEPIGFLRTSQEKKYQLPPQPDQAQWGGVIELLQGRNYDVALRDLEGFQRIWVLWWFHKNDNWRPTTLPPRGRTGRKGTFSTRSPYRPNPLGLSCLDLIAVDGLRVHVGAHDLLDQTPIFDIKPYIPRYDAFPRSKAGWHDELERQLSQSPTYRVNFSVEAALAVADREELKRHIVEVLSEDPYPHRTRRIIEYGSRYRMSCGDWRIFFQIESDRVRVEKVSLRE